MCNCEQLFIYIIQLKYQGPEACDSSLNILE